MPAIDKRYVNIPIGQLGLKHRVYKHLCSLGVQTIGDLFTVPEDVLALYSTYLLEAIARVKRNHVPPS